LRSLQKEMESNLHESVLRKEVLEGLHIEKTRNYIDATVGNGGHTVEILKNGGNVLGIELDPAMLAIAEKRIKDHKFKNFKLVNANFTQIDKIAEENGLTPVSGILFDLGVTNLHLKDTQRGFSFANPEANLDMRIDPVTQGVGAADLLNVLREDQLRDLFEATLEPGAARWISGRVVKARSEKNIETVGDMLEICKGLKTGKGSLNEATLPFLALRIAVNSELDNLSEALPKAFKVLGKGGRLVVISFHSKEDVIVKEFFKEKAAEGSKILTHKPILATSRELDINKRSRSAKMRVLEKN